SRRRVGSGLWGRNTRNMRVTPMQLEGPVDTKGYIDTVALEDGVLRIDGWVASFDAGAVEAFKVYCTGKVVTECEAAMHLASPDVAAVYPDLVAAATCRFQVRVRLSAAEQERASASVIGLTPVFDGREGRMMLRILQPVLPLPDEKDVEYIGGGFMSVSLEFL